MKYVSIDIETTELNKEKCQVLEIGAISEDTNNPLSFDEIPKYKCIIGWEEIMGSVFAIDMNNRIIKILAELGTIKDSTQKEIFRKKHNIIHPNDVAPHLYYFLYLNGMIPGMDSNGALLGGGYAQTWNGQMVPMINNATKPAKIYVAGKNFASFDAPFLQKLPRFNDVIQFGHRMIDPAMAFINWTEDEQPPSLSECKKRAGLENNIEVSYNALEDAWDVIQVLRTKYSQKVGR
ncbi:MAG TPA: hypothetical protein P5509_04630 [Bacteroidales bacterium]|nr:hypothetical protein [Bacteroidales bacterium]